jgi:hypothetical protein
MGKANRKQKKPHLRPRAFNVTAQYDFNEFG